MYDSFFKRIIDLIISPILILLFSPLYLFIGLLILVFMGRPILFKQQRIGKNGKMFNMYKFRTMKNNNSNIMSIEDDHKRLTKIGVFLRSTSLDELPELINILKGNMSFIGPRPLPAYYLPYYNESELIRHSVRGGLVPCDVLTMKSNPTWEEQFECEKQYVKNESFLLDIKIFLVLFYVLFKRTKDKYGVSERQLLNEYRKDKMVGLDEKEDIISK